VTVPGAVALAVALVAGSLGLASMLPWIVAAIVGGYFLMMLGYSFGLKNRPILDVILIASGFVLRAVAGAAAVHALVSPWLVACTFTLCMFLGFGKRRCELATLTNREEAGAHRSTLLRYSPELLNHLTSVSAGIAIMAFLLYTMDTTPALHPPFKKEFLLYTLPLVTYALFRYAMLIETGRFTGPMQIFRKDKALGLTILLWTAAALAIALATRDPALGPHLGRSASASTGAPVVHP
jgi:4-hydroxybenzoate polyprenyltransferase